MYVNILHTKSLYLMGNTLNMFTFIQKEYLFNFYHPSLLYLVI